MIRFALAGEAPAEPLRLALYANRRLTRRFALHFGLRCSSNVQRNIIGEHVLGLPPDQRPVAK